MRQKAQFAGYVKCMERAPSSKTYRKRDLIPVQNYGAVLIQDPQSGEDGKIYRMFVKRFKSPVLLKKSMYSDYRFETQENIPTDLAPGTVGTIGKPIC